MDKAGVTGDQVDYVIMGQVTLAGAGQNPARTAAVAGGVPMNVPSITINKVCLSGINAIALADQLIRAGEVEIVVAGGMESMTQAPHLLPKSREGFKYGDTTLLDSMAYDALWDQATAQAMGMLTEQCNAASDGLTREEQDEFAAALAPQAAEAWKNGVFDDEVVPVEIPQRRGDPVVVSQDEECVAHHRVARQAAPRLRQGRHDHRRLGVADLRRRLRGRGDEQGEGGVARPHLARRDRRARAGRGSRLTLQLQPSRATAPACEKEGIAPTDLDLVEFNEAFAAVGIASTRDLGLDAEKVNVNGGAISLGHPVGMSGAGSCCTSRWSSSAVAAASAPPLSVVAVDRATP